MSLELVKNSGDNFLEVPIATALLTRRQTTLFQTVGCLDCFVLLVSIALFCKFVVFLYLTLCPYSKVRRCELATPNSQL